MRIIKMTFIEQLFGEGVKKKDLTKEQLVTLSYEYKKRWLAKQPIAELREAKRVAQKKWRDKNKQHYRDYQNKYRKERAENDEAFRLRLNEIAKEHYERQKRR